ncbi:alpha-L-fucosidase domain-containing protein [Phthorimaea operculella]|nr:alpha-L-fucosidase domain-containing protein [Phthorimaea operculella]
MKFLLLILCTLSISLLVSGNYKQETVIIQVPQNTKNTINRRDSKRSQIGSHSHSRRESVGRRYKPEWSDLDTRPIPEWYDRAKIGIFLHWGVYSVPSFGSEWFWSNWKGNNNKYKAFMAKNYPPGFTYQQFAPEFKAEFFNPDDWAELFQKAGAKYVVLTSKHHEGFTLFPSKQSFSWNAVDVGPHRDLVGDLATAIRNKSLDFGVYHSLYEWYNPLYLNDMATNFNSRKYVQNKLRPDIEQLITQYEPSVFWSDGDWDAYDSYWNSTDILAWMYNDSPVKDRIVVNDRWGKGTYGKHGDFYNYEDRFNPGKLLKHKWENAFTVDAKSWGYRRNIPLSDILSIEDIIKNVVSAVSCGGNALINVGPTKEGTIAPIFQERLLALGAWLGINGEAIYNTSPWLHQNDTANGQVWYTCINNKYDGLNPTSPPEDNKSVSDVNAIILKWPETNILVLKDITSVLLSGSYTVEMLGQGSTPLKVVISENKTHVTLPDKASVKSEHAWVLKFHLN